jgi:outer membrane protein TolC
MKKIVLVIIILTVLCLIAFPQNISIEQARIAALLNSKSLAQYRLNLQSSLLDEKNFLFSRLPVPSAQYSASTQYLNDWELLNPFTSFIIGANLAVSQSIYEGGRHSFQKALLSIATESIRKDILSEYFNVLDAVDSAYYAVLEAAASLNAEESFLQNAYLSFSIAEIRRSNGMLNPGDYLKALADKEARENSRNQARRALSLSLTKLKMLTGISEMQELQAIDFGIYENVIQYLSAINDEEAGLIYNRFWLVLLETNPALAKAALNGQRAENNLSLSKRDYYPRINATIFSGTIRYSPNSRFTSISSGGITVAGSIPVDFWLTGNKVEKSKIAADIAALSYTVAENSLEAELQSSLLAAFSRAGSVLSSRRMLEYSENHFEFVMERYKLSQSSVSELSDASSMLINSRNNFITAHYGFLQSLSRLRSLAALELEDDLIKLLMP